jgi:hypothetical protein
MPSKIQIVNGAYSVMRISGLTVSPSPEDSALGVQVLDDLMAELSVELDTGYIQPINYGESDANDDSGLTAETVGPVKKMLARELLANFGKPITNELNLIYNDGLRKLEQLLVNVLPSQNPATLPIGSGNEYDYRSNKFYSEPNNDDGAQNYYKDEVFQLPIDWSSWLAGVSALTNITYKADSGLNLTEESFTDDFSTVTIGFNAAGQFTLCVMATNSNGDVREERFVYNSTKCRNPNTYY